jgi:PKD repeat protein
MEMKKLIIYGCLGVSLLSCKEKIEMEPTNGEPVFYLRGMADQTPVDIVAGENNYYLYSTNDKDDNDIYQFTSILKQDNCVNECSDEFQIIVKDFKQSDSSEVDINAVLGLVNYQYHSQVQPPAYRIFKFELENGVDPSADFTWDFGDGFTSKEKEPYHLYNSDGSYDASLKADFGGCTYELKRSVDIGPFPNPSYKYDFVYQINGPSLVQFSCVGDSAGANWLWEFGDGTISSEYNPTHTYAGPVGSDTHVKLIIITRFSDTIRITKQLSTPGSCEADFDCFRSNPPIGFFDFSRVIINWKDRNGILYTSNYDEQPASNKFSITEVDSYQTNEKGEKTKKFLVKFDCDVWSEDGTKKELRNMEGIVAVSYPE